MRATTARNTKRSLAEAELEDPIAPGKGVRLNPSGDIRTFFNRTETASASQSSSSSSHTSQPPQKKAKVSPAVPKKPASKKSSAKKTPAANKLYSVALKNVDTVFSKLMKQYKPNPKGWSGTGVTSDNFAEEMAKFLPQVEELQETCTSEAFKLLMYMADHAYGDMEYCFKASGFGETDGPFRAMDECALQLINQFFLDGEVATSEYVFEPSAQDFGGESKLFQAILDGKKRPNAGERQCILRARVADLKAMMATRQKRREATADWAGNALNDLAETRKRIEAFGIGEHYFSSTIGRLAEFKGVEKPEYL